MRPARRPLTTRMVIAFVLFGSAVALSMAAFVLAAFVYTERQHVRSLVDAEMKYLRDSGRPHVAELEIMSLYQGPAAEVLGQVAVDLAALPPGVHRLRHPPRLVAVELDGETLRIVSVALEPMHGRERQLLLVLAIGVALALYGSAWAGFWLSRRVVAPLRQLARRVRRREADTEERLAEGQADDEIGALARALDAYEARIRDLLERERHFTDRASHELRTPITVISGASELLLADAELGPAARQRVERIRRATLEMAELVETFLLLARGDERSGTPGPSGRDLAAVVQEAVESQSVWLEGKPVTLGVLVQEEGPCPGPERLLAIIVANLVRNACQYTETGAVEVEVWRDRVVVADTGPGLAPEARFHSFADAPPAGARAPRRGLGLPLVRALCERQGWTVSLAERDGGGTLAILRF